MLEVEVCHFVAWLRFAKNGFVLGVGRGLGVVSVRKGIDDGWLPRHMVNVLDSKHFELQFRIDAFLTPEHPHLITRSACSV
jgi:hypothetical protein